MVFVFHVPPLNMSKHPKPGGDKQHPGPHQQNAKDEKRSVSGNVHVRGEIVVEPSPSEAKARNTRDEKEETRKRKVWWLEIATFVVLSIYAGLTFWLAFSSQQSVDTENRAIEQAKTQFAEDQRPYIWMGQRENGGDVEIRHGNTFGPLNVTLWFKNYGRSPAIVNAISGDVEVGPNAVRLVHPSPWQSRVSVMPSEKSDAVTIPSDSVSPTAAIADIAPGLIAAYVRISYQDMRGHSYESDI